MTGGTGPATRASAASGDIATFAGGPGTGWAASVAMHPGPMQVMGNRLFVADSLVVRTVDLTTGITSVVARTGVSGGPGGEGNGGPATAARLQSAEGIAIDQAGNVFFAEGNRLRRVDAVTGVLATAAGNGLDGSTGDSGPANDASFSASGLALDGAGASTSPTGRTTAFGEWTPRRMSSRP